MAGVATRPGRCSGRRRWGTIRFPGRPRPGRWLSTTLPLLVLLAAACGETGTGSTEPEPGPVLRGTVHPVGGASAGGLWAIWSVDGGATADSARILADGTFEIEASASESEGELLVDGSSPRAFHPFLFPFHADSLDGLDVLLIPRQWTIRAGVYRGESVPSSLDPAVEDDADQYLYSYYFGQPDPRDAPERYLLDLMAWPEESLPAKVAIDHAGSSAQLTADDSIEVWQVLDRMEEVTGLDLFEPAVAEPGWWSEGESTGEPFEPGVIRLVHDDPPRWGGLPQGQAEGRVYDHALGSWAAEGRFSAFRERHRPLGGGRLSVGEFEPLRLADGFIPWETVLVHETMHVLGVGHTCRIPSPMGPCMRTSEVSKHDVAYMELLRETLRLARELGAPDGMMPSVIGERRILLEASALPNGRG